MGVTLTRESFKSLLAPIEDILKRNSEKYIKFVGKLNKDNIVDNTNNNNN